MYTYIRGNAEIQRGWISCGHAYNSRNDGSRVEIAEVRGYERG